MRATSLRRGSNPEMMTASGDDVDPRRGFERADISALLADDPPLHLLVLDVQDAHRRFHAMIDRGPLYRLDDDLLGFCARLGFRHLTDILEGLDRLTLRFVHEIFHEHFPGVFAAEAGGALQALVLLPDQLRELLAFFRGEPEPLVDLLSQSGEIAFLPVDEFNLPFEVLLPGGELFFKRLAFISPRVRLFFEFLFSPLPFHLRLGEPGLLLCLGRRLGTGDDLPGLGPGFRDTALALAFLENPAEGEASQKQDHRKHSDRHNIRLHIASGLPKNKKNRTQPVSHVY